MKTPNLMIVLLSLCTIHPCLSQENTINLLSAAGGTSISNNIQIDWAIGEPFVANYLHEEVFITEGLLQPVIIIENEEVMTRNTIEVNLAPNPVLATLFINLKNSFSEPIKLKIYSITGQLIDNKIISPESATIPYDMENFPAGTYLFKFFQSELNIFQSFKIIKAY